MKCGRRRECKQSHLGSIINSSIITNTSSVCAAAGARSGLLATAGSRSSWWRARVAPNSRHVLCGRADAASRKWPRAVRRQLRGRGGHVLLCDGLCARAVIHRAAQVEVAERVLHIGTSIQVETLSLYTSIELKLINTTQCNGSW